MQVSQTAPSNAPTQVLAAPRRFYSILASRIFQQSLPACLCEAFDSQADLEAWLRRDISERREKGMKTNRRIVFGSEIPLGGNVIFPSQELAEASDRKNYYLLVVAWDVRGCQVQFEAEPFSFFGDFRLAVESELHERQPSHQVYVRRAFYGRLVGSETLAPDIVQLLLKEAKAAAHPQFL